MRHVRDPDELTRILAMNAREGAPPIADVVSWLANPRNFALADGDDLSLFEAKGEWPGPFEGHIFFASRGKQALAKAKAMLAMAFGYGATCIDGKTPHQFRDALMFARLLGFKVYGDDGRCTLTRLCRSGDQLSGEPNSAVHKTHHASPQARIGSP